MKKLLHTSKYDITKIKASNPDVMHRYVREGNTFVDRVTGMEFPIDGHIELPVSNMRDTQSQMAVTFTLDENVMTTGMRYELFRVGTFDEPKVIVLAVRQNNASIALNYRINREGSPVDVNVTGSPSLHTADRVTILLDPRTMGLVQSRGDGYSSGAHLKKNIRQSASSHATTDQWNPHDLRGGFTTEFSDIGCDITIVEEFTTTHPLAFGGISGQTPEYLPLCVHTEDDEQRMLLNTYFDQSGLVVIGQGLTHNGTEANGAILLEDAQLAVVAVGNEGRSARFISLPKTGEEAWFIIRNESQEFPVYLGSDGVVTALGRKAAVIQPCAMHFVWIVVVDGGCEVYCDGQPVCRIPIISQDVELVLTSTANRVTGIQLFDCDVRTRSIFRSNAVSNNRPWWVTHTHLVGFGNGWNNGFIYDVHNFYGSDDPKHAEYLGEIAIGGRTSSQLSAGTTRDIKIPFETCAELVGLLVRSRTAVNSTTYPLTRLLFNLNGEEYDVRLSNVTSNIGISVFKGSEELESFRIDAGQNRASSYNSYLLTSIQVAKGRMQIMFTGICTEVRIPVAKQYSLSSVRFVPYTASVVNNYVQNILGYTAKADTFGMLPHPDTTPAKNLWKQDGRTVFELSGNDLCELVSDTPFDFPVNTWILGAVNGNYHVITTSSESPCVVPCDVPELSVFTVQVLIYEQKALEEFPSVYDFGDLQIEVCVGAEGRAGSVTLGDTVIDVPRTQGSGASVQELLVEADGQTLRVYYAGEEIRSSAFNGTIAATNELVISRKDTQRVNSKIGGLRIMDEACALEIMGRGYSAPYSLEYTNE